VRRSKPTWRRRPERPFHVDPSRPVCANTGHSPTAWRTCQIDPFAALHDQLRYGRRTPESGRRRYGENAPGAVVRESPYTDWAVLVGRCLGDIAGRTEQPRRTRTAPPAQAVASALHPAAVVHGNGWVDECRCATGSSPNVRSSPALISRLKPTTSAAKVAASFLLSANGRRSDSRIAPWAEGRTVAFTSP
jgi:hypothetical protein